MSERVKRSRIAVNYTALDEGVSSGDDDFFDMGEKHKSKPPKKKKKKKKDEKKRKFALSDSDDDFVENRHASPKKAVSKSSALPLSPKVTQAVQGADVTSRSNAKRLSREERSFQKELERALEVSKAEAKGTGHNDSGLDIDVPAPKDEGPSPDRKPKPRMRVDPVTDTPASTSNRTDSGFRLRINALEGSVTHISTPEAEPAKETSSSLLSVSADQPKPTSAPPKEKKETPKVEKKKSSKESVTSVEKHSKQSISVTPQAVAAPSKPATSRAKSAISVETKKPAAVTNTPRTPSLPSALVSSSASPLEALSAFSRMSGIRVGLSRSTRVKSLLKS